MIAHVPLSPFWTLIVSSRIKVTLPRILYHSVTSRKVTGSVPDKVIEIFYSFRPCCVSVVGSAHNRNKYKGCFREERKLKAAGA
jgi:hypothetical protein